MRTKITLEEFVFSLNINSDKKIIVVDYNKAAEIVYQGMKSNFKQNAKYSDYKDLFVQDFFIFSGELIICVTKELED